MAAAEDQCTPIKSLADAVAGRRALWPEHEGRQEDVLARDADHAATECGKRNLFEDHRKVESSVHELRAVVAVEFGDAQIEGVDLDNSESKLGTEELHQGCIGQCGGSIVNTGQQRCGIDRDYRADIVENIAAKARIGLKLEKTAPPEARLLGIDVERIIDVAPEVTAGVAAAGNIDLRRQQQIEVDHDAHLAELVAPPAPITGETRPIQHIPAPGRWDGIGLRIGGVRAEKQK